MLQFLRVKGCPRMTSPGAGDLQSKSRSKANFSSFWSRSGARRRRASLMLKFRKNELFWLKSWCFGCANSRKRRFQGRFSGGKRVESGVSLVKCVISVHVQLRSPTNVLLEKTQKNPVPPRRGIVVSRLEKGPFSREFFGISCGGGPLNCSDFGLFEYFRCPKILPPLVSETT